MVLAPVALRCLQDLRPKQAVKVAGVLESAAFADVGNRHFGTP